MAIENNAAFERAVKLAVVTGLRAALGPALLAAAYNRPERNQLAMAALGEMVVDKLPFVPSRSTLPMLVPRALAGAWVVHESLKRDGVNEPWAAPLGAAVAVGAATFAPKIRGLLHAVLGIPQPVLGAIEDYLALRMGGEAVGLTMDDLKQIGGHSFEEIKGHVMPAVNEMTGKLLPTG